MSQKIIGEIMKKSVGVKLLFILILVGIIACSCTVVQAYYADVIIDVSDSGLVDITGQTDVPSFLVQDSTMLTSKNNGLWLLNVSLPESFSPLVYEINLPSGVTINYMHLPSLSRVESTSQGLVISGVASQTSEDLLVQYSLQPMTSSARFFVIGTFLFLLFVVGFFIILKRKKIPFSSTKDSSDLFSSKRYIALPSRQKEILKAISKKGDVATQAQLEKELFIPKSSLSRNINSLCAKGFLRKEQNGMTNTLYVQTSSLQKEFSK